jgi:hypothetical protein
MTPFEIVEKALKEAKIPYYTEKTYYNQRRKSVCWIMFEENFDNEGNEMGIPFDSNGQWIPDRVWQNLSKHR